VRIPFLIFTLLIAAPAFSQEGAPREPERPAEAAPANSQPGGGLQQPAPPAAATVAPIINVYRGKPADEATRCASPSGWKDWKDLNEWKEWSRFALCRSWEWVDADRFIAIWIVILSVVTFLFFLGTRKMVKDARNAANRREQDSRILQRAYLSVQPDAVRRLARPHETARAGISIVNSGYLPARNIAWVINQAFSDEEQLKDFPVEKDKAEGANVIVPQSHMLQDSQPFPAGLGTFATPESSSKYLYVWGAVFYDDGFGGNRTTKFCHRYNGISYSGSSDVIAENGRLHSYGNDAD
jgi:hypothetical protein